MQQISDVSLLQRAKQFYDKKDFANSIVILKELIKHFPNCYEGWLFLSKCLYEAGYVKESAHVEKSARQFDPLIKEFQQIQLFIQQNSFADAEKIAKQMLQKIPGHPRAVYTLSHVAMSAKRYSLAETLLREGIAQSPTNLMLQNMLIDCLCAIGKFNEAIETSRQMVEISASFDTYWRLINLLRQYAQYDELLKVCEIAKQVCANDKMRLSEILLAEGQILRVVGERQKSIAKVRESIALNPVYADAWWSLADLKNYEFSEADRTSIQAIIESPKIHQQKKCAAMFALAKASESLGDINSTLSLYEKANQMHPTNFNPAHIEIGLQEMVSAYTSEILSVKAEANSNNSTPIFILGLPRSGSTLVEQILASHSKIVGTIEQPTLPCIEKRAESFCLEKFGTRLFDSIDKMTPSELAEFGQAYFDEGALFRKQSSEYFTDKHPFNFRNIGFISKILPSAIIVDVRRNPMDCGLSLYKQYFPSGVEFSYNLTHIGAFYNSYLQMMDYWQQQLPGKIFSLQYEELVKNPETIISGLLDHIGVNFEANCLNFHNTGRAVHTASSEQVRQPLNKQGIGAWRQATDLLEPLKQTIDKKTLDQNEKYFQL